MAAARFRIALDQHVVARIEEHEPVGDLACASSARIAGSRFRFSARLRTAPLPPAPPRGGGRPGDDHRGGGGRDPRPPAPLGRYARLLADGDVAGYRRRRRLDAAVIELGLRRWRGGGELDARVLERCRARVAGARRTGSCAAREARG